MTFDHFYAIELDPTLAARHEPIISEDRWIAENIELITELGPNPTCKTYWQFSRNEFIIVRGWRDFLVSDRGGNFGAGLGAVAFREWVRSGW